jgi:hypothetical protein
VPSAELIAPACRVCQYRPADDVLPLPGPYGSRLCAPCRRQLGDLLERAVRDLLNPNALLDDDGENMATARDRNGRFIAKDAQPAEPEQPKVIVEEPKTVVEHPEPTVEQHEPGAAVYVFPRAPSLDDQLRAMAEPSEQDRRHAEVLNAQIAERNAAVLAAERARQERVMIGRRIVALARERHVSAREIVSRPERYGLVLPDDLDLAELQADMLAERAVEQLEAQRARQEADARRNAVEYQARLQLIAQEAEERAAAEAEREAKVKAMATKLMR